MQVSYCTGPALIIRINSLIKQNFKVAIWMEGNVKKPLAGKIKELLYKKVFQLGFACRPLARRLIPSNLKEKVRDIEQKVIKKAYSYTIENSHSSNIEEENQMHHPKALESGVNLVGYIRADTGVGEACRLTARSLASSSTPFGIINFQIGNVTQMNDISWKHKETSEFKYNTNIFHINAGQMLLARSHIQSSNWNGRYNIGHWVWELPEFPDEWKESFNVLHEVWVPTSFVHDSISKKANIPVFKVPYCIQVEYDANIKREYFGLPEDTFLFLSMYDVYSIQERKNPYAAINAFKSTFLPDDMKVGLVVKINNTKGNIGEVERIREYVREYRNIHILDESLSRREVNTLLYLVDSFISLHRSEGFGLVLAESMYLRKPVIGTNWSANTDFMNKENSCAVDYRLIQLGQDYGPYKAHQYWADPDLENACYYMRKLVQDEIFYKEIALKGQETIFSQYSPSVVGNLIKGRLDEINRMR
jgi:glycosyltransferase involved in cell wall biosynthesis